MTLAETVQYNVNLPDIGTIGFYSVILPELILLGGVIVTLLGIKFRSTLFSLIINIILYIMLLGAETQTVLMSKSYLDLSYMVNSELIGSITEISFKATTLYLSMRLMFLALLGVNLMLFLIDYFLKLRDRRER
jgi:hypothetical protein